MFLVIVLILSAILAAGLFLLYMYWAEARQIWRSIRADKVSISLPFFVSEYLQMKIRSKLPPNLIFEAWLEGKKAEIIIDITALKNFYKIIDYKLPQEIEIFNKKLIAGELRLKRLWSRFILGGSLDEVCMILTDPHLEDKELVVKGRLQTKSEKDFGRIVQSVIVGARGRIKELLVNLPPEHIHQIPEQEKKENKENKDNVEIINSLKHFKDEFQSNLEDSRIYLSKGDLHKELRKYLFKDTYKALYNSMQSGLDIQFRDIEAYLNRNINIRVILELLNRLHNFDQSIDLQKLDRFILLLGENENILRSLIDARKAGVPVNLEELWDYHLRGGNMSTMQDKRSKAYSEGVQLEISELTEKLSLGRNVEEIIEGLIKLHKESIEMSLNELSKFQKALKVTDTFVQYLIRASHLGLNFSYSGLLSFGANGGDILKLMDVMIKAKQADLDVTIDDCMKLDHDKSDFSLLLEALKIKKRVNLDISKERLMNLQSAGGNMHEFAQALELSTQSGLNIKPENIEADLVEGRKVREIILAIMHASKEGLKIDYNICIKYDRSGLSVPNVVKWAIEPIVVNVEPISILTKDAIEIKLGVNVTVRGKFYSYFNGSRNEVLTARVNEALIKEVERYTTYLSMLESLNHIAERLLLRLTAKMTVESFPELELADVNNLNAKEEKLNSGSAFEIIDINIPIIDVNNDTLTSIKKEIAELEKHISKTHSEKRKAAAIVQELEAKAKLIEARAELQLGMAEAFRKGHMNTKEYHKMKILDDNPQLSSEEGEDFGIEG